MTRPSKEVVARSQAKIYKRYHITLRKDSDTDLIDQIEAGKSKGLSPSAVVRELWEKVKERDRK